MTPADLAEDMSNWPHDAFELLGVARGADDKTIRRAYNALIRRFKPEHFPEQFRRIREAFETCQLQSQWYRDEAEPIFRPTVVAEEAPTPEAEPPTPVIDPPAPVISSTSTSQTNDPESTAPRETNEKPKLTPAPKPAPKPTPWQRAILGREEEAYKKLVEHHESHPKDVNTLLQLYWLLISRPQVDRHRLRHEWLGKALVASRLQAPAAVLYVRECEAAPNQALSGHYETILKTDADAETLVRIARARIIAAAKLDWNRTILEDMKLIRDRVMSQDSVQWLMLLGLVQDWQLFQSNATVESFVEDEVAKLRDLELKYSSVFDRIDEVRNISHSASAQKFLRFFLKPLMNLARAAWANHGDADEHEVFAAVSSILEESTLTSLLSTKGDGFFQQVISMGCDTLSRYWHRHIGRDETDYTAELCLALLRHFRLAESRHSYSSMRPKLLAFLSQMSIAPREFAYILGREQSWGYADNLAEDNPLQLIWLAQQIWDRRG
jgi:hypothetical protein